MGKATAPSGALIPLEKGYLDIPGFQRINFTNLPEVGDSKSATYNSDSIIGRSSPIHTYAHSDTRQISLKLHFFILNDADIDINLMYLNAIRSCVYPREANTKSIFMPPPVCRLRFGNVLAVEEDLCVILQQYSTEFPTEVAYDERTYLPYKFDISTTWWVVYASSDLPTQNRIIFSGR